MTDQPTALRLAEFCDGNVLYHPAAAELRRLHAENESLKQALAASCDEERDQLWEASPGGGCSRARSAEAVNRELLEALKLALSAHGVLLLSDPPQEAWKTYGVEQKARAAIAKAEGEQR